MKINLFFESAIEKSADTFVISYFIYSELFEPIHVKESFSGKSRMQAYYTAFKKAVINLEEVCRTLNEPYVRTIEIYFSRVSAYEAILNGNLEVKAYRFSVIPIIREAFDILDALPIPIEYKSELNASQALIDISNGLKEDALNYLNENIESWLTEEQRKADQRLRDARAKFLKRENINTVNFIKGSPKYFDDESISVVVDGGFNRTRSSTAGAILLNDDLIQFCDSHYKVHKTSNHAEHDAFNSGLRESIARLQKHKDKELDIYTDSQYVIEIVSSLKKPKQKDNIAKQLASDSFELFDTWGGKINVFKVKGHVNPLRASEIQHLHNEVDELSTTQLRQEEPYIIKLKRTTSETV